MIERIGRATPAEAIALAARWSALWTATEPPWPPDADPDDYAALQILGDASPGATPWPQHRSRPLAPDARAAAQNAVALSAHVAALRPIFSTRDYAPYLRAWDSVMNPGRRGTGARAEPTVRRA